VADEREAVQAMKRHRDWVITRPGVEGLGVSRGDDGTWYVGVYTNKATEETRREVHTRLAPVSVVFVETGPVTPLAPADGPDCRG